MYKSRLTVLTAAFALLTGVSYAAEKIAFTCSDEKNEAYSFVFDLDRKMVSSSMKTGGEMSKLGEMWVDLARNAYKPVERVVAK